MSIAHSVTVIAWKIQKKRDTKRSQWQHSVPRALRTETNFQTNGELFNSNYTLHSNGFKCVQRHTFLFMGNAR
ncbi:hypothetical protein PoB_000257200 [Plakobranchus ocellatus]|uniref:Uncharacterized protein n=1 Tax=Plakobranchus ocellatus TaxID=259542 RepID=A0AAV3XZX8_9GAST|nr:hypothetical protein PoB_000257200 [Plakobranchus ocellatus]